ncbi:MAG: hypothetical protein AAB443_04380 [Patescibacteria group bacterium]
MIILTVLFYFALFLLLPLIAPFFYFFVALHDLTLWDLTNSDILIALLGPLIIAALIYLKTHNKINFLKSTKYFIISLYTSLLIFYTLILFGSVPLTALTIFISPIHTFLTIAFVLLKSLIIGRTDYTFAQLVTFIVMLFLLLVLAILRIKLKFLKQKKFFFLILYLLWFMWVLFFNTIVNATI